VLRFAGPLLTRRWENATLNALPHRNGDSAAHTRRADIVVAAVGVPRPTTADMVGEGATVADVGIIRVVGEDGKAAAPPTSGPRCWSAEWLISRSADQLETCR
jgi:methylenetetrahydrofolate dehydrogenase (NADP+)/methenyltetrahydrofolate cyclohydrolase